VSILYRDQIIVSIAKIYCLQPDKRILKFVHVVDQECERLAKSIKMGGASLSTL
jgi:hypothetical protein